MNLRNRPVFRVSVLLFLVAACGEPPAEQHALAEKEISAEGGTVDVTDGALAGTRIGIPPGAVSDGVKITIAEGQPIENELATGIGPAVEFGPNGTQFSQPVTLTLPFDVSKVPEGMTAANVVVLVRETADGPIELRGADVDLSAGLARVEAEHFTTFQVAVTTRRLEISGLAAASYVGETWVLEAEWIGGAPPASSELTLAVRDEASGPIVAMLTTTMTGRTGAFPSLTMPSIGGAYVRVTLSAKIGTVTYLLPVKGVPWGRLTIPVSKTKPTQTLTLAPSPPYAGQALVFTDTVSFQPGVSYSSAQFVLASGPTGFLSPAAETKQLFGSTLNGVFAYRAKFGLTLFKAGTYVAQVRAGSLDADNLTFTVLPAAAANFAFASAIPDVPASAIAPVRVNLIDAYGNPAPGVGTAAVKAYRATGEEVTLVGTSSRAVTDGFALFNDLRISEEGDYRLEVIANAEGVSQTVTSNMFHVTPSPPSRLWFTAELGNGVAGVGYTVTVALMDAAGFPTAINGVPVTISLPGNPGGDPFAPVTLNTTAGKATFNSVTLTKAASGYIMVASSPNVTQGVSAVFNVAPGPPTNLALASQPSTAGSGVAQTWKVEVCDSYGNRTTSNAAVTAVLSANPGGDVLRGTTTVNAFAGVATFSDLVLSNEANGYQLVFSSPGLTNVQSAPFDVTAAQ